MIQYSSIAKFYDVINGDDFYLRYLKRIEGIFKARKCQPKLLLELACGTGTMSRLLSQQGYEMIASDISAEMLDIAREKCAGLPVPPVFICQDMCELDLYGTIDAAICCLDSINYLESKTALRRAFEKVSLFLNPKGLFIFDVKSIDMFEKQSGTSSVFEDENGFCVWQYAFDKHSLGAQHQVDIFLKNKNGYKRNTEEHYQRAFSEEQICVALENADFKLIGIYSGLTAKKSKDYTGRLLFVAEKR